MKFVRALMLGMLLMALGSLAWTWFGGDAPVVRVPSIQVEVLNGCGDPGLAQKTAERLHRTPALLRIIGQRTGSGGQNEKRYFFQQQRIN